MSDQFESAHRAKKEPFQSAQRQQQDNTTDQPNREVPPKAGSPLNEAHLLTFSTMMTGGPQAKIPSPQRIPVLDSAPKTGGGRSQPDLSSNQLAPDGHTLRVSQDDTPQLEPIGNKADTNDKAAASKSEAHQTPNFRKTVANQLENKYLANASGSSPVQLFNSESIPAGLAERSARIAESKFQHLNDLMAISGTVSQLHQAEIDGQSISLRQVQPLNDRNKGSFVSTQAVTQSEAARISGLQSAAKVNVGLRTQPTVKESDSDFQNVAPPLSGREGSFKDKRGRQFKKAPPQSIHAKTRNTNPILAQGTDRASKGLASAEKLTLGKSRTTKFLPKSKRPQQQGRPLQSGRVLPNSQTLGKASAYLKTMKPVNFERKADNVHTQKAPANTDQKQLVTQAKKPSFNPALIYGRQSVFHTSASVPSMSTASGRLGQSATKSPLAAQLASEQAAQEAPSNQSGAKPNTGKQTASKKIQNNPLAMSRTGQQPSKNKKSGSFTQSQPVSLTQTHAPQTKVMPAKSQAILAASESARANQNTTLSAQAQAANASSAQAAYRRNHRYLVDKQGQRVRMQPQSVQLPPEINYENNPQTAVTPQAQNEINFSLEIHPQQSPQQLYSQQPAYIGQSSVRAPSTNLSPSAPPRREHHLTRPVQSSQQAKRQVQEFKASFQSHANSSQGFHSQEMVNFKQSCQGGITTQLSFKINQGSDSNEAGVVQLKLTQSSSENTSAAALQSQQDHLRYSQAGPDSLNQIYMHDQLSGGQQTFSSPDPRFNRQPVQQFQNTYFAGRAPPQLQHPDQYSSGFRKLDPSQASTTGVAYGGGSDPHSQYYSRAPLYMVGSFQNSDADLTASDLPLSPPRIDGQVLKNYETQRLGTHYATKTAAQGTMVAQQQLGRQEYLLTEKRGIQRASFDPQPDQFSDDFSHPLVQSQYQMSQAGSTVQHQPIVDLDRLRQLVMPQPPPPPPEQVNQQPHTDDHLSDLQAVISQADLQNKRRALASKEEARQNLIEANSMLRASANHTAQGLTQSGSTTAYEQARDFLGKSNRRQGSHMGPKTTKNGAAGNKESFGRVTTAQSQQVLARNQAKQRSEQLFQAKNLQTAVQQPRRKYRPVLPKSQHNLISRSVQNQKSPSAQGRSVTSQPLQTEKLSKPEVAIHVDQASTSDRYSARSPQSQSNSAYQPLQKEQLFFFSNANLAARNAQLRFSKRKNRTSCQGSPSEIQGTNTLSAQLPQPLSPTRPVGSQHHSSVESCHTEHNVTATFLSSENKQSATQQRLQPARLARESIAQPSAFSVGGQEPHSMLSKQQLIVSRHEEEEDQDQTAQEFVDAEDLMGHEPQSEESLEPPKSDSKVVPQSNSNHRDTLRRALQDQSLAQSSPGQDAVDGLASVKVPRKNTEDQPPSHAQNFELLMNDNLFWSKLRASQVQPASSIGDPALEQGGEPSVNRRLFEHAVDQHSQGSNLHSARYESQRDLLRKPTDTANNEGRDLSVGKTSAERSSNQYRLFGDSNRKYQSCFSLDQQNSKQSDSGQKRMIQNYGKFNGQLQHQQQKTAADLESSYPVGNQPRGESLQLELLKLKHRQLEATAQTEDQLGEQEQHVPTTERDMLQVQRMRVPQPAKPGSVNTLLGSQGNSNSRYGAAGVVSIDSMSQASSSRRQAAPAKVIYNKFFKEKGFLPPLMNAANPAQPGASGKEMMRHHIQYSRSHSVNSQASIGDQTNRTLESLRMRARSPDSQIAPPSVSDAHSERKAAVPDKHFQGALRQRQQLFKPSANQMHALIDVQFARVKSMSNRELTGGCVTDDLSQGGAQQESHEQKMRKFRQHMTAEKSEQETLLEEVDELSFPRPELNSMTAQKERLVLESVESNSASQPQSCFSQALAMAFQQAPIQNKNFPQMTKPHSQTTFPVQTLHGEGVLSQPNRSGAMQSHFLAQHLQKQHQQVHVTPSPKELLQKKSANPQLASQTSLRRAQIKFKGGSSSVKSQDLRNSTNLASSHAKTALPGSRKLVGIKLYSGKEKPDEVMKLLELKYKQRKQPATVAVNTMANTSKRGTHLPISSTDKKEISLKRKDPTKQLQIDSQVKMGASMALEENNMKHTSDLQEYRKRLKPTKSMVETGSEERQIEQSEQGSALKKIVSQERLKYRLKSSKVAKTSTSSSILSPSIPRKRLEEQQQEDLSLNRNDYSAATAEEIVSLQSLPSRSSLNQKKQAHGEGKATLTHESMACASRQSNYLKRLITQHSGSIANKSNTQSKEELQNSKTREGNQNEQFQTEKPKSNDQAQGLRDHDPTTDRRQTGKSMGKPEQDEPLDEILAQVAKGGKEAEQILQVMRRGTAESNMTFGLIKSEVLSRGVSTTSTNLQSVLIQASHKQIAECRADDSDPKEQLQVKKYSQSGEAENQLKIKTLESDDWLEERIQAQQNRGRLKSPSFAAKDSSQFTLQNRVNDKVQSTLLISDQDQASGMVQFTPRINPPPEALKAPLLDAQDEGIDEGDQDDEGSFSGYKNF